ncbi:MAG: hypothetical protein ACPW61_11195 [Methyloligella sp. ZOD6]
MTTAVAALFAAAAFAAPASACPMGTSADKEASAARIILAADETIGEAEDSDGEMMGDADGDVSDSTAGDEDAVMESEDSDGEMMEGEGKGDPAMNDVDSGEQGDMIEEEEEPK